MVPMTEQPSPPLLTPRRDWLREIGRTDMWYRDHENDLAHDPPLPRTVKQGRNNFIVTAHGDAYKRAILRKAGIPAVGRPRKPRTEEVSPAE